MGFPRAVNVAQALAVAGDFCSSNPRGTVNAGPGGFVAGSLGVTVGLFAWADANMITVSNVGAGVPTGFLHREQQALITNFLAEGSNVVPSGFQVALTNSGDVYVTNAGSTTSAINQKAYANNANGSISFAATGSPTTGGTSTASTVLPNTSTTSTIALNSVTGSISGTVLTVTAIGTGALSPGDTLAGGTGGTGFVNPASTIVSQLTGTKGSTGTYLLNVSGAVTSTTITASGGTLTVSGTVAGFYGLGQTITGGTTSAGTVITALISGAGGAGTYRVNNAQTVTSAALIASGALLTIGGTITGRYDLNDIITGAGVTAGSTILGNSTNQTGLTGNGGAGTYLVSASQTLASQIINVNSNIETKWYAASVAAPGELVKMTSTVPG